MSTWRERALGWLHWPCLIAVCVWAFSDQILPGPGHLAQVVIILPVLLLVLTGERERALRVPVLFLIAALAIQLLSWSLAPEIPGYPREGSPKLDHLARWCLFLFPAFWLLRQQGSYKALWLCAATGLLLAPWITGGGWNEIAAALSGERVDFGLRNAQHTGLFAGTVALGSFAGLFAPGERARWRGIRGPLLLVVLAASTGILLASQTRGVWLGCLLGAGIICLLRLTLLRRRDSGVQQRWWSGLLPGLTIAAVALVVALQLLQDFEINRGDLRQLGVGEVSALHYDTVGIRLRSWYHALPWIAESPLVGWGTRGSLAVSQLSEALPPELKQLYTHLHSSYVDLTIQYGLPAVALMLAMLLWLSVLAWRARQAGRLSDGALLFVAGFTGFWLVANAFESYMLYSSGRFLWNLVFAGVLACHPLATGGHTSLPALNRSADG